jgi:hypothetical protein
MQTFQELKQQLSKFSPTQLNQQLRLIDRDSIEPDEFETTIYLVADESQPYFAFVGEEREHAFDPETEEVKDFQLWLDFHLNKLSQKSLNFIIQQCLSKVK